MANLKGYQIKTGTDVEDLVQLVDDGDGNGTLDPDIQDTLTLSAEQLTQSDANDGDVLKWNDSNSAWEPQQDARTNVSDNETEVVSRVSDINFGTRLDVTDDGDKQVTIDIPITGSDDNVVTGTAGDDGNLVEWNGDGDAVDSGVSSSNLVLTSSSIDALDDVDTSSTSPSDGDILKWNDSNSAWEPGTDTRTGVSDDDSEIVSRVSDINFGTRLDVTDDDDDTVTVDIPITGSDDNVVTGTAGDDGNLVEWNGDGDAVDSGVASSDLVLTSSSIDALDDVDTTSTSPSDGDVLKWNDSNSAWEPGTDTDTRTAVSDNDSEVVSDVSDINFGTRLDVTNDDDDTVTIDIPITGSDDDVVTGTAGDDGNLVEWNGDGDAIDSGVATSDVVTSDSLDWTVVTSSTTASVNDRILADTSDGSFTVTLPSSPSTGNQVYFADPGTNWSSENLTVEGDGDDIEGSSSFTADTDEGAFLVIYNGSQWIVRFGTTG